MQTNATMQNTNRDVNEPTVMNRVRGVLVFAWEVFVEAQNARAQAFSGFKYPG